jgi:hypothetical protein
MADLTTAADVLKNDFIGPIRSNLNNKTILMNKVRKTSEEVSGDYVKIPLQSGRNSGVGARAYNGTLPTAGSQQYKYAQFQTKTIYGRGKIYGKLIRATRNDKGSFLRAVSAEMKGLSNDLTDDVNRQLFTGSTGVIATVAAGGAASATQTVDSTQYLFPGMVVTVDGIGDRTVSSITSETVVVFTATITTSGAEVIRRQGVATAQELQGLGDIVKNSGTIQNIDPTTSAGSFFKANLIGTAGTPAPLDEMDMEQAIDAAEEKGGEVDYIITSYAGRREYYKLLQGQKRFTDTVNLKGGFSAVMVNDIALVVDKHCPRSSSETRMYFLSSKNLAHYRMCDVEWMDQDGAILARIVGSGGEEAYECTLVYDAEFATDFRAAHSALVGIAVT